MLKPSGKNMSQQLGNSSGTPLKSIESMFKKTVMVKVTKNSKVRIFLRKVIKKISLWVAIKMGFIQKI